MRPLALRLLLPLLLLLPLPARLAGAEKQVPGTSPRICEEDLHARLAWLAADARRGRDAISPEARETSAWIAGTWAALGLLPHGTDGSWFQPFVVPEAVLGEGNRLETTRDGEVTAWQIERDWNPFSVSRSGAVEGDVVFAGYGIHAPKEHGYDDYADLDVRGKVVLVFRKNPGWREVRHAAFLAKLEAAATRGAAALLLCNDPATVAAAGGEDRIGHWSASLGAPAGSAKIPYAFVSQGVARALLGEDLPPIEKALREEGPRSHPLAGVQVRLTTALATTREANARNVVGFLPGRDPDVADEVIVLGAHYDHIGLGLFGSTGGAAASGQIHNGADDNGSGTAALVEMAEHFAHGPNRPRRSLLFVAFTGEERGLLGSRWFVEHPTVPLTDVVAMLNLDMVGRGRGGRLQVGGVGTAAGLKDLVARANEAHGLRIEWDPQGEAPTDSASFFRKDLPVLFFFTGLHEDYHKPTDDLERIAFADMARITRLACDVGAEIAERDKRLAFTRPPEPPRPPVLGVRPLAEPDPRGVVVAEVVEGGPAAAAGLQAADVIVALAGQPVRDVQTLLAALVRLEAGKTVPVLVLREGEEITLKVTLAHRPRRRD